MLLFGSLTLCFVLLVFVLNSFVLMLSVFLNILSPLLVENWLTFCSMTHSFKSIVAFLSFHSGDIGTNADTLLHELIVRITILGFLRLLASRSMKVGFFTIGGGLWTSLASTLVYGILLISLRAVWLWSCDFESSNL